MKAKIILLLVSMSFLYSCMTTVNQKDDFLPTHETLKKGIIYKYYYSTYSKETSNTKTDVQYNYLKMVNDSVFSDTQYNPAFRIEKEAFYQKRGPILEEIKRAFYIYNSDTIPVSHQGTADFLTFGKDTIQYTSKIISNDFSRTREQSSHVVKDTTINSKPAKIIHRLIKYIVFDKEIPQDTIITKVRAIYIKDFGLWKLNAENKKSKNELILVEQILPEKFEQLASHVIHRVGHINFEQTLDKDKELELCFSHNKINDYYNGGQDRGGYIGGKGNLKKYINSVLDSDKLKDESGYLGFRFVINCKGKAGEFLLNEAGFDYQKKNFNKETTQHLYEIISSIPRWSPCIIRGEERDSYAYVTFILKNGKIQDILP
ncbi:hypothetical protein [Aquimarina addita]